MSLAWQALKGLAECALACGDLKLAERGFQKLLGKAESLTGACGQLLSGLGEVQLQAGSFEVGRVQRLISAKLCWYSQPFSKGIFVTIKFSKPHNE